MTEHSSCGVVFRTADHISGVGGVVHGFSTRFGGVSEGPLASLNLGVARGDEPDRVRENYRRWFAAMGMSGRFVMSRQVHGTHIRVARPGDEKTDPYEPRDYEADGLMTDLPGVALVVFSADCLPILLYDPVKRAVCAIHAGWRGSVAGIAAKAVAQMRAEYGTDPADLLCAIGPGIDQCHFETDGEVPAAVRACLPPEQAERCIREVRNGKYYVNLKRLNSLLLQGAGVPEVNIMIDPECTACNPEKYWSHRLIGPERGSLAAAIQLT